jgi:hypothetical protein
MSCIVQYLCVSLLKSLSDFVDKLFIPQRIHKVYHKVTQRNIVFYEDLVVIKDRILI